MPWKQWVRPEISTLFKIIFNTFAADSDENASFITGLRSNVIPEPTLPGLASFKAQI